MPASMRMPDVTVEIAFVSTPDDPAPTWTDVSAYVEAATPIGITRGRSDELTEVQPSRLQVTLDNSDGRFTPGNTAGAYYPNVKKNKRIRVSAQWPLGNAATNKLSANASSMETSVAAWSTFGAVPPTLSQSSAYAHAGTKCLLVTYATSAAVTGPVTTVTGLTVGQVYRATAWVLLDNDTHPGAAIVIAGVGLGSSAGRVGQWRQVSIVFTATATSHDIQIWPARPATTSGERVYVDDVKVAESSIFQRFTGWVDEWPVVWPSGTGTYSQVTVTASSRRARLASGVELRSVIEEEYLLDSPAAYYPLGEAQPGLGRPGQAGDVSGNQQPNLVATGAGFITWQGATGPGTDNLSAPVFADNGRYLEVTSSSLVTITDTSFTLEAFVTTTSTGTSRAAAQIETSSGATTTIGISAADKARASSSLVYTGATDYSLESSSSINDGEVHHLAVRETYSTGFVDAKLFLDGVEVATTAIFNHPAATSLAERGTLRISSTIGASWTGSISHVALTRGTLADARIAAHAEAGLTGFDGESSDERIQRLATYVGIDPAEVITEAGLSTSVAAQEFTGHTTIEAMQQIADTEGGLLFDAADGALTFHSRSHRYNTTAAYSLDANLQQIESSVEARMDGGQLANDVIAIRAGGDLQIRATNPDSITEHGIRRQQLELFTTSDAEVTDAANWKVQRYAEPDIRIHTVTVDLINQSSALIAKLLDTDLGDRITLSNLPAQAPAASYDGFVEGITEAIGGESYSISFELSPALQSTVWQLDSSTYSLLGTSTILAY